MAQVKIYGLSKSLNKNKASFSAIVHKCMVQELSLPEDKMFQRFFHLDPDDFIFPPPRTKDYTILEIHLFEGRSIERKKAFIHSLISEIQSTMGIQPIDIEITLIETPKCNWGIRGFCGDELRLNYNVNI